MKAYTKGNIDGAPVDDDITYTILGLLIAEEYTHLFTTENMDKLGSNIYPVRVRRKQMH